MNILHFIVSFHPKARGASHAAVLLAKTLRKRGVDIAFIVEDQGPDWRNGGEYEGFQVHSFPLVHPGKCRKFRGFLEFFRYLRKRKGTVHLLHVHAGNYMNLLLAYTASRILHIPCLMKITLDGWDTPDGVRASRHGRLGLFFYRKLNAVVAMTSGQADTCRRYKLPGILEVIPNAVDTDRFHPPSAEEKTALRNRLGLPAEVPILVYAGWLGYRKGTDVLFQVWHRLLKTEPQLHLLLVGNYMSHQEEHPPLSHFLVEQGLPAEWATHEQVHLDGETKDMDSWLKASDLFVFPSRKEGFGTVQIEAMACGLPCLVNDLPGVSIDIFPDESCGFRIPNNDIDNFVEKARDLLSDPEKLQRIGKAARVRAESCFSKEYVANRYLDLYQRLTAPNRKTP